MTGVHQGCFISGTVWKSEMQTRVMWSTSTYTQDTVQGDGLAPLRAPSPRQRQTAALALFRKWDVLSQQRAHVEWGDAVVCNKCVVCVCVGVLVMSWRMNNMEDMRYILVYDWLWAYNQSIDRVITWELLVKVTLTLTYLCLDAQSQIFIWVFGAFLTVILRSLLKKGKRKTWVQGNNLHMGDLFLLLLIPYLHF